MKVYYVLLIYQYLSLSGYQVIQQSQEAYQVSEFLEMFLTHDPTQLTKKLKKISTQPNPNQLVGQANPWTTLGHL